MSIIVRRIGLATIVLGLVAGISQPANADLFNNINAPTAYGDQIQNTGAAASFSTGTSAFNLSEVDLRLELQTAPSTGTLTVALYNSGPNYFNLPAPSTLLTTIGTLSDSSLTTSFANYRFQLSSAYTLAANTQYWIVLSETAKPAKWAISYDVGSDTTGLSGQYYTFGGSSNLDGPSPNGAFQMDVIDSPQAVAAVPEPSSFAVVVVGSAIGLAGFAVRFRRKAAI